MPDARTRASLQAVPPGRAPEEYVHVAATARRNGWSCEQYGASVEGVPLLVWMPPNTPTRLIVAAVHGEEAMTAGLAHTLLRTIDAATSRAAIVAVANPDGLLGAMRQNARGVDLNRNWPTRDWSAAPSPTFWPTTTTRTDEHRTQLSSPGSAPGSEPEVQALVALISRLAPTEVIDLHAPLECVLALHPGTEALAAELADRAGLPMLHELDSPTPGDSGTWCAEQGIISVTYEIEAAPLPALWERHAAALTYAVTGSERSTL
ncbi:MAG: zinc carboxypeptidase [Thermoleophilia bacterium]|nr:zinc carboxypeptidase [Thermoleophilia bacterium]